MIASVSNFYTKLARRGALLIHGPQSLDFLQGQTTCDVSTLDVSGSLCGAFCTPQGRMVCDFRLLPAGDET